MPNRAGVMLHWQERLPESISLDGTTSPGPNARLFWDGQEWQWPGESSPAGVQMRPVTEQMLELIARAYQVPSGIVPPSSLRELAPQQLKSLARAVIELGGEARVQRFFSQLVSRGIVVVGYIGGGGWGHVFRALAMFLKSPIAIKVLKPPYDQEWRERFSRESAILARLCDCPAVVGLEEWPEEVENLLFLQMELIHGRPLSDLELPVAELAAVALVAGILDGLIPVHDVGIVHRDLHLGNVMITLEGKLVILDFGLAKDENDLLYSLTFKPVGAMSHCALEKWRSPSKAGAPSDLFSVGVMLYKLVTGKMPFWGSTYIDLYEQIRSGFFEPPSRVRPDLSRATDAFVSRMMAKDPTARPRDAREAYLDLMQAWGPALQGKFPGSFRGAMGRAT